MTEEEIRANILEAGYKASKEDKSFNLCEVSKDWGEERERVEGLAGFMEKKGLIRQVDMDDNWEITEQGICEYERTHG